MNNIPTEEINIFVLWKHYKFILTPDNREELYNLKNDPSEANNLSRQAVYYLLMPVMRDKFIHSLEHTKTPLPHHCKVYLETNGTAAERFLKKVYESTEQRAKSSPNR